MTTVADLLIARADDDRVALRFEDRDWTYREVLAESRRRAALWSEVRDPAAPPHIGVLLENTAEYLFWMGAAALARGVIVGLNSTYRAAELGKLITHTDCQLVLTGEPFATLLDDVPADALPATIFDVDTEAYRDRLDQAGRFDETAMPAVDDDLFLLIFTSGSTNFPKAVRCTQGRFARTGAHVANISELADGDGVYAPLPFFHSSSLFTGLSAALNAGVPFASRRKFSASKTLPDIRRTDSTLLTYTGKVLNYVLATPPQPTDTDSPLRLAIGNEASVNDLRAFSTRFGCQVRDSYGSTEGVIIVRRDPSMPEGALGQADASVKVLDPETGEECPPARFDEQGRLVNALEATGELVNTAESAAFEGYYRNEEATATRFRDGVYWSGDLAYRDADGWFYFAGRADDWLRVDSENFAAGTVEAILGRHEGTRSLAVFAVPDDKVGDRVMVAIEPDGPFDPVAYDDFLAAQVDLGPKWIPTFVRVTPELPKLASMKLDRRRLRHEAWTVGDVYWRPTRGAELEPLTDTTRDQLRPLLP